MTTCERCGRHIDPYLGCMDCLAETPQVRLKTERELKEDAYHLIADREATLAQIEALCRQMADAERNPAHGFAVQILKIIEDKCP